MEENINDKLLFLKDTKENRELLKNKDKCDKYDYLIAVACGAIGGMVDIFCVGSPEDSMLGKWTDKQVDIVVKKFAKILGWNPQKNNSDNVKSAIGFLERKYKINYDQRKPGDVDDLFNIAPGTHHMMSLAHSPDIVGLFFSILNQFTETSTFIADGRFITVKSETFELQGSNFVTKIMCGIANWIGHLMSDIAGSSGARGRGTGIVIPFYEFLGLCKFGSFTTENGKKDLAEIAVQAFSQGYDFRFGMAQSIPLIITEMSIKLIWSIRQRFCYHKPLKECFPNRKHADLRVMLIVGDGTLCVIDGLGAGIMSGGNALKFFMHLNLIAWFRLVMLVLKEVCIRIGIKGAIDEVIEAYKRVNEALKEYLYELRKIDINSFKIEVEKYNNIIKICAASESAEELNKHLLQIYENEKIEKPWEGDFAAHMSNRKGTLVFK